MIDEQKPKIGWLTDSGGNPSSTRLMMVVLFINLVLIMNFKVIANAFTPEIANFLTWGFGIILGGGALKTGAEAFKK